MYEAHPSIISIKENVNIESRFSFIEVNACGIKSETMRLKTKEIQSN